MKKNTNDDVTDLTYLKQVSNGDDNFIIEMIDVYLRETPEAIRNLENHFKNKEWKKFRAVTHKMKPSFSFFGLKDLYATVDSMEEYAGSETHLERLPELISKIKLTCLQAMQELENIKKHK